VRHTGLAACIEVGDDEENLLDPDVALAGVGDASILIAPQLFETASPETTLARLNRLEVRVIISPGFEVRFYQ
jgi:hypothetical protein